MRVQSAIASTPTAAWQGYLLGGLMWFCIPFTLSTGLGLATVACDLPVSVDEANMVTFLNPPCFLNLRLCIFFCGFSLQCGL